jgi:5-methylthioadenosine/S-adenosylhomocysteine deaminase
MRITAIVLPGLLLAACGGDDEPPDRADVTTLADRAEAPAVDTAEEDGFSPPVDATLPDGEVVADALADLPGADLAEAPKLPDVVDALDVAPDDVAPEVDAAMDVDLDVAPDARVDARADAIAPDGGGPFPTGIGAGASTALPPERRVTCDDAALRLPSVTAGVADRVVLRGRVVTPTAVLAPGEVLIVGGALTCVAERCDGRTGYAGATVIDTGGVIYPGLVSAHDHVQYDFLPPWTPPMLYGYSDAWQAAPSYRAVTAPLRENEAMHTCAMLKWGEARALVSGTTSVQGALNRVCATRTMARNVEYGSDFGGVDTHRTNALGIDTLAPADVVTLRAGIDARTVTAYIVHLAEGVNEAAYREWNSLVARDLVVAPLVVIHGTALGRPEFDRMAEAGAKLVWSPRSNLVLYGRTTDVGAALDAGLAVALAPDWTPTGSPNLLVEMRFAREFSRAVMGGRLRARDLFEMATARAALALDRPQVGSLVEGRYADVLVVPDRGCDAYDTLLDAPVADVRLVMVGGRAVYGDAALIDALPEAARARCEPLAVCAQAKRVCVALADTTNELDRTLAQVEAELGAFATPYPLVPQCPP